MKKFLLKFFYGVSIPDTPDMCIPCGIKYTIGIHETCKKGGKRC